MLNSAEAVIERDASIMKNRKHLLWAIFVVVVMMLGLMTVFVTSLWSEKGEDGASSDADSPFLNEPSKDEMITSDTISEDNTSVDALSEFPDYYHSASDADASSIYLGGVGGIYRINSESEVQTLYSTQNLAGAALYGDYIFSLEYNISDEGMTTSLIRINKESFDKEDLVQVSSGSYDLRIVDNTLILSEAILGDYGIETVYQAYTLNIEGNLTSDTPEDGYNQFGLPDGYDEGMRFLINPWFSMKYFGYICFVKTTGETGINGIWIRKEDQESAEEVVACSGEPLVTKDEIFYCSSDGEILMQRALDDVQESMLYEIPKGNNLSLLTYDAEWVYFIQISSMDESNESTSLIMRVNPQDQKTEEIYKLQIGDSISNFNVYGNNCYFILSGVDNSSRWECCSLTDFAISAIH